MEIIVKPLDKQVGIRPEIEQLEQEKKQYSLLGKFLRRKGTNLYHYSEKENHITCVEINSKTDACLIIEEGNLEAKEQTEKEAIIEDLAHCFEAVNNHTASKRVERFKAGRLSTLCNLRPYNPEKIKALKW